jgi:Protein of unknown function (DUF1254)
MLHDYIGWKQRYITCPSQDLIYGFGILDLAREPVVVQVPDFGKRYWVYQATDLRTDGFADLGTMYGTKPGFYLLAGPDWDGKVPPGIAPRLNQYRHHHPARIPGGRQGRQRGIAALDPTDRGLSAVRVRRDAQDEGLVRPSEPTLDQARRRRVEMGRPRNLLRRLAPSARRRSSAPR